VDDREIEPLVAHTLDRRRPREWYWALMDYGAMFGEQVRGAVKENPNLRSRHYMRQSKFAGSDRELRGKLLRLFLKEKRIASRSLAKRLAEPAARVKEISEDLVREGFLVRWGDWLKMV